MKYPRFSNFKKKGFTRLGGLLLSLGFLLLLNDPLTSFAQQDGISIGQTVRVTTGGQNLNLRSGPGINYEVIAKLTDGTLMTVVDGPRTADGYTWWELDGEPGRGWAVEEFLRVVEGVVLPPDSSQSVAGSDCEQAYSGIQYCAQNDKTTHVVLVDLNDPHVSFETVMANDVASVNTGAREYVQGMGARHLGEGAVVVINADYFGGGHGPEGFTIVNGKRLDGEINGDNDNNSVNRSSLVFSKSKLDGGNSPVSVTIQRFSKDKFTIDPEQMYNAVGGGPQIIYDGKWDWTRGRDHPLYRQCPNDTVNTDIINGECFRDTRDWDATDKMWTVIGITTDGQLLLLVAPYPEIQSTLEAYQVKEAIKLDGGGSSQLWYNNQAIEEGDGRQIANGLMVFYKNAYEVVEQTQWPVIVAGESVDVRFVVRNKGADTWTTENYSIGSTRNPWNMSLQFELPNTVGPGGTLTWEWKSQPIETWGIYDLEFQLVDHGNQFPMDPILFKAVVVPQELADKKEELERKIQEWIEQKSEDIERRIQEWIEQKAEDIWQLIVAWIEKQLQDWFTNCLTAPAALAPFVVVLLFSQKKRMGSRK